MTLAELSDLGQAIGAIAVLVSLAAVWWQVRQTNTIAKAELTHSVWQSAGQTNLSLYDTPDKAELMHRALFATGPLSDAERLRMDSAIVAAIAAHEAAFNLRQRDLCELNAYTSLESGARPYLRSSIVQEWWSRSRKYGKDPT